MHTISLGFVKVPTPGTPVLLSAVFAALNVPAGLTEGGKVHKIEARPLLANTGIVYAGQSGADPQGKSGPGTAFAKGTGVGLLAQIQVPATTGHEDKFVVCASDHTNSVNINDYAFDAAVSNEGFVVFAEVL